MGKPSAHSRKESRHDGAGAMFLVNMQVAPRPTSANRNERWRNNIQIQRKQVVATIQRVVEQLFGTDFVTSQKTGFKTPSPISRGPGTALGAYHTF